MRHVTGVKRRKGTTRGLLGSLVAAIDRWQRRLLGVYEFSDDPRCILRLKLSRARTRTGLSDGAAVEPGEPIGVLHLWNEHMPQIPPAGPDLAWARALGHSLIHSFRLLAGHALGDPDLADVRAFRGQLALVYNPGAVQLLRRIGWQVSDPRAGRSLAERALDLGTSVWTWLLGRAFNPGSIQGPRWRDLQVRSVWISRRALIAVHGPSDSAERD